MADGLPMLLLLLLVFHPLSWCMGVAETRSTPCSADGIALYKVTFQTFWSSDNFWKQYPTHRPHAQWSRLIGRTHHQDYVLWRAGQLASNGFRQMAEEGTPGDLDQESQGHDGVFDMFSSPRLDSGVGQTATNVFLDSTHHLVSLVAHLVPSPDWFVGLDSVSLCLGDQWETRKVVELGIWDSGTDKGFTFTSPNWPEVPPKPIEEITASHPSHPASSFFYQELTELPSIARVIFTRDRVATRGNLQRDTVALKGELIPGGANTLYNRRSLSGGPMSPSVPQGEHANTKPAAPHSGPVGKKEPAPDAVPTTTSKHKGQRKKKQKLTKEERRMRKQERQARKAKKLREKKNKKSKSKSPLLVSQRTKDVDCQVSEWQEWSVCSKTCGYGTHTRTRTLLVKSSGRGAKCPSLSEEGMCGSMRGCGWSHFNWDTLRT